MALWEIKSPDIVPFVFSEVTPDEVLAEFEGPLTFVFHDDAGLKMLAHLCAIGVGLSRYLVCKTSENTIEDLKNGMVSIRRAILRRPLWIVDVYPNGRVQKGWETSVDELPEDAIPDDDVLLNAELEELQQADEKLKEFAKSDNAGQAAIDGAPVVDYEIDADFYGRFCQFANSLLVEICDAMEIPQLKLRLGMTSKSSYAVDLKVVPPVEDPFSVLFGSEPNSMNERKLRKAFEQMVSMMVDDRPSPEIVRLVQVQSLRHRYGEILELFAKNAATLSVRTRGNPTARRVSSMQAAERLSLVRELGYPYKNLSIHGEFIGGTIAKAGRIDRSFLIRVAATEDSKDSKDYRGTVAEEAIDDMKSIKFGEIVDAQLHIEEQDGAEQTYKLVKVAAASR